MDVYGPRWHNDDPCTPRKNWTPPLPERRNPRCMCGRPLLMVIRPGAHVHPCPVHPNYAVYGPNE